MVETRAPQVDPTNAEALKGWDGDDGAYWAMHEAVFDNSVARHHRKLMAATQIASGERVLDIGCGNGQTTRDAARLAAPGSVLGVDLSSHQLERAVRRAAQEGITNVRFEQADAQIYPFEQGAFDVAISRTGVMFFGDPVAAFSNIARALRPSGRLVCLVWQSFGDNEWLREFFTALAAGRDLPAPAPDAPGPCALGDPKRVRKILDAAGFVDVTFTEVREPMNLGPADDAYDFISGLGFARFLLQGLDDAGRPGALGALRASIDAHATAEGVQYDSAAWIIGARRA